MKKLKNLMFLKHQKNIKKTRFFDFSKNAKIMKILVKNCKFWSKIGFLGNLKFEFWGGG